MTTIGAQTHILNRLVQQGGPSATDYAALDGLFRGFGDAVRAGEAEWAEIHALWPLLGDALSADTMQGFVAQQPHGYAGDFEVIDRIYQRWVSPRAELRDWDHYFHGLDATQAVRNRKEYFIDLVTSLVERSPDVYSFRVLDVGSGPARDVAEYLGGHRGNGIMFDCVDSDGTAIEHAQGVCRSHLAHIRFHRKNIFRFKSRERYNLIWSAGLFDYLDDRLFKHLLSRLVALTAPGGEVVVGNFSTDNPSRDHMEFGNWFLIHRTRGELSGLATDAGIPPESVTVGQEALGVNLFLHVRAPR